MTAGELADWETYYTVDPFGERRADLRHGILCSLTDACHRAKGSPQPPRAYMPFAPGGQKGQSIEDQKAIFAAAKAAFDKASKRKR